ncbi:YjjG family noncanonical pyrimidine nucleotidase [Floricoccus penangensis]|uniref:YjjG family noncanonical pyrimidine nucleotidase n=1 Tax=Floricoccus penangensis TaxID=1859475 RepID=UPI00203BC7BE|nr:YjjG family noncanonical pyrimidine nucleotidase [Floricoccus penangensis]URZ87540.1 YjjG family noncanonical pyrimidine nucleotidase [Floricoccus penangensis]
MKYKTLLFDLDDTILDFGAAEDYALAKLFEDMGVELTDDIKDYYLKINKQAWKDYEDGKISRQEVTDTRFANLFATLGIDVDGPQMDNKYRSHLAENPQFLGKSLEVLEKLSQDDYKMYILTNGVSVTQHKRLKDADLYRFFEDVIVSEETGYQKPMVEFFNCAFERIENFNPDTTLMIGDTLSSDIKGGNNAGVDTVWLNNKNAENLTDAIPTYVINNIEEIYSVIK